MPDPATASFALSQSQFVIGVFSVVFLLPLVKFLGAEAWARIGKDKDRADKDTSKLQDKWMSAFDHLATEVRTGFAQTHAMISQQNVNMEGYRITQEFHAKTLEKLETRLAALEAERHN